MNKKKGNLRVRVLSCFVVILFMVLAVSFQVKENEFVVVKRFGKIHRQVEPGLSWKWPSPFEKTASVDRRVQTYIRPLSQTSLKKLESSVMLSTFAMWRVSDPKVFLNRMKSVNEAEKMHLDKILATHTANTFSQYQLSDILNGSKNELSKIKKKITQNCQDEVKLYGVEILYVGFKQMNFPPNQVTDAVIERMRSERQVNADQIQLEGRRKAQEIIITANAEARQTRDRGEILAQKIRAEGEVEAAKFYKEFSKNPELAVYLNKLDALRDMLKGSTTLILDTSTPPFDVFNKGFVLPKKKGDDK